MISDSVTMDQAGWLRMESGGSPRGAVRAAEQLGHRLDLPSARRAELAIVVTELATNLLKHARRGMLLIRPVRRGDSAGVEVIAVDSGPGMADLACSARDGHSTTGTLGIGLGAIARRSSWYDAHSVPGRGTVVAAQVWARRPRQEPWAGGVARALGDGTECGDGFGYRVLDGRRQVLVCDGLGHGPLAAAATRAALRVFREAPAVTPAELVELLHAALAGTRGAALAVAELDGPAGLVRFSGLGNISASVLDGDTRHRMVSLPGIAGHQRRAVREYDYPLPAAATVVLHTDGVIDSWRIADYPGLAEHAPQLLAATLLRDAGVRRDDACVLAARVPS